MTPNRGAGGESQTRQSATVGPPGDGNDCAVEVPPTNQYVATRPTIESCAAIVHVGGVSNANNALKWNADSASETSPTDLGQGSRHCSEQSPAWANVNRP